MRATCWWPALAILVVAGCSTKYQAVTPELQASFLADLQAGKLNLDCGEGCALTWGQRAAAIHAVDIGERWQELATDVMQIGFGNDLAYYYLGQAAQGLGYHRAAIGYYSQSLALATGQNPLVKCTPGAIQVQGNDPCQGVNLVSDIPVLIQASREAIAQQQQADAAAQAAPPPVRHHHHKPASTATAAAAPAQPSAAASAGSSVAAVPADAAPAPTIAAAPPPAAAPAPGLLLPPPPSQ